MSDEAGNSTDIAGEHAGAEDQTDGDAQTAADRARSVGLQQRRHPGETRDCPEVPPIKRRRGRSLNGNSDLKLALKLEPHEQEQPHDPAERAIWTQAARDQTAVLPIRSPTKPGNSVAMPSTAPKSGSSRSGFRSGSVRYVPCRGRRACLRRRRILDAAQFPSAVPL